MSKGADIRVVLDDGIEVELGHAARLLMYTSLAYARERNLGPLLPASLARSHARSQGIDVQAIDQLLDVGIWVAAPGGYFQTLYSERTTAPSTERTRRHRANRSGTPPPNGTVHEDYQDETVSEVFPVRSGHVPNSQPDPQIVDLDTLRSERLDAATPAERRSAIAGWAYARFRRYPKRAEVDGLASVLLPLTSLLLELDAISEELQARGQVVSLTLLYRALQEREGQLLRACRPAAAHDHAGFQRPGYSAASS